MSGNDDENGDENDNENVPSTSTGSALVQRRNRRKPIAEKIGDDFASPGGVVKNKAPK